MHTSKFINRPYALNETIKRKMWNLASSIYGASLVEYAPEADTMIHKIEAMGYGNLPICVAKTQYSFSDDPTLLCAPIDFTMKVNEVRLSAGAGFIVLICGKIMTMPGLPKVPAAENIYVDNNNKIVGLF
jgi:formate--tetrahydrofolate ligase